MNFMSTASPEIVLIYITAPDKESAARLARALVEERLAACVNIGAPIESVYRWKGAVETAGEIPMIAKTRRDLVDRLVARVRQLHPYEVPCVIALPVIGGHAPFLQWVCGETA